MIYFIRVFVLLIKGLVVKMEVTDVETDICKVEDLEIGEMREVDVLGEKALLVRNTDGTFCAFGHKCTHQGTRLIDGVFLDGRIRCPKHGACFNSKTGDIEDYPGLDSLPKHDVKISTGGDVVIRTSMKKLREDKRVKCMVKGMNVEACEQEKIVIIGGGASALTCSETLRQEGFTGQITIISKSSLLPYDRPVMTKDLSAKIEDLFLRSEQFFRSHDIEFRLRKEVKGIKTEQRIVKCSDGEQISYSKLLLCTGLKVRRLDIPGGYLPNVFVLGTPMDANVILEQARGKTVVVVGASFMGMEIVSCLADKCKQIIVCCKTTVPFERSFGCEVGAGLQRLHERKGIKFRMGRGVVEIRGNETVEYVVLDNGDQIKTEVVIAGVGVDLTTGFLNGSGIKLDQDGYVVVDSNLRTNVPGVFASGAIARFPLKCYNNQLVNIEHWQMAHYLGKVVALNMLKSSSESDEFVKAESIPYFWTEQYGVNIQYTGFGDEYDDVIIKGDVTKERFCAFYLKNDLLVAVATMKADPVASMMAERLLAGEAFTKKEVKNLISVECA